MPDTQATPEQFIDAIKSAVPGAAETMLTANPALADARDPEGISALMWTVYMRQEELTTKLRRARTDLDLFEAAATGDLAQTQTLIGADKSQINTVSPDGFTALHLASYFGHPAVVAWLLTQGAEVNAVAQNSSKVQPLHSATAGNHEEIVGLLLTHGADPNAKQQRDFTPLMAARQHENSAIEALLVAHGAVA